MRLRDEQTLRSAGAFPSPPTPLVLDRHACGCTYIFGIATAPD
jgi:hypothetical protein